VPDTQVVSYDYGDFTLIYQLHSFQNYRPVEGIRTGVAFYGPEATMLVGNDGWRVIYGDIPHEGFPPRIPAAEGVGARALRLSVK